LRKVELNLSAPNSLKAKIMKIVFPDETAIIKSETDIAPLKALGECVVYTDNPQDENETIARIKDADVAVVCLSNINSRVMDVCPKLKHVCFIGLGAHTCIDIGEATRRGIWVTNTPDYGTNVVAEHAMGLLLAVTRRIVQGDRDLRKNKWEQKELIGTELYGKTIGIIGLGPIGARTNELAKCFGMKTLGYTRNPDGERAQRHGIEFADLDDLLMRSDFISLHIASTSETCHIIDQPQLAIMKESAILINTARGNLVNPQALCRALKNKEIAGAGLDVFEAEPLPGDHPLLKLDNAVITPHIAWNSTEAGEKMLEICIQNILSFTKGEPRSLLNKEVLERGGRHSR
jgi:glyoxylate reductase